MIAYDQSSTILLAFSMEVLLKAVAAFIWALVVAFKNSTTLDFASFFFEVFFRVFGTRKIYLVTAW